MGQKPELILALAAARVGKKVKKWKESPCEYFGPYLCSFNDAIWLIRN